MGGLLKGQPRILIVDDDAIFLNLTVAMVEKMGYAVITAPDGIEAIELFERKQESISLVMLDINMPKMNGIDAFKRIRELCKKVNVVIVSGCLDDAKRKRISPLRPTAYINKPLSFGLLADVLRSASQHTSFC